MKFQQLTFGIYALLISVTFSNAWASSPISGVGTSTVNEGEMSLEWRTGFTEDNESDSDDQRFRMRQHMDYGFNDWYAVRLITLQNQQQGDNLEHQAVTIENRFQIIESREHGWDAGIRLIYTQNDGDKAPNEIDVAFLSQVNITDLWQWRQGIVLEHEIGEKAEDGLNVELRNQVTMKIMADDKADWIKEVRFGAEMFNDFGKLNQLESYDEQSHQLGPVLKISFNQGYFIETGYRAGISEDGADHLYKLFIGRKF